MKRFKSDTTKISAGKKNNSHMTHIEDLILNGGVSGARQSIAALSSLGKMLAGNSSESLKVSTKWDGAPSIFAGIDPTDGTFFVAKKSIFNKNPKVYKSLAEVDADTSGDLAKKLKLAFTYLKDVGITNVVQGDFMYEASDLKRETLDGVSSVTFHPNTIVYAVPLSTKLATRILDSKIGVVWHTAYEGETFETMTPTYGATITSALKQTKNVWMADATMSDLSSTATLSAAETDSLATALKKAGKTFRKVSSTTLKEIEQFPELNLAINTFYNTKVRANKRLVSPKKHVQELIVWVNTRYNAQVAKAKTAKGKAKIEDKRTQLMSLFFSPANQKNLENVFELQKNVTDAKLIVINKLNDLSKIGTFTKSETGYVATNPEGFVVIDHTSNGAVKLVDRLEFSTNNFNPAIIKGWQNPG